MNQAIKEECDYIREILLAKQRQYGDINAYESFFSKLSPIERLRISADDKISRLQSAQGDEDEDVEQDLIGYLILLRVARRVRADVPGGT